MNVSKHWKNRQGSGMNKWIQTQDLVLLEAAVIERLRRGSTVTLHPTLVSAPLIYDETGRAALRSIYEEYMAVAQSADVPFLMCTPTWRANRARVVAAKAPASINVDAVRFLQEVRGDRPSVYIGGMTGCQRDCYRPEEGLSAAEAESFHAWQIDQLAGAGADFLLSETLPNVEEAVGIARAMAATDVPYLISFVISRQGRVLDGTALMDAIRRVDAAVDRPPIGFMVNCAYPTFLCAAEQPPELFKRLIGCQANASSLDHCDLDGADQLQSESVADWAAAMRKLHTQFGFKILGGCCGTNADHLRALLCD
jgi:S-methylmethionine-dependent homocysteine/selenocysteine methylase